MTTNASLKGVLEMTNYEKMQAGELSNYKDAEIVFRNSECVRLMRLARIAR